MTPKWYHRLLIGGESGPDVEILHRKLGIVDTHYGEASRQMVRGIQQVLGIDVTGVLDPDTATYLGEAADSHLVPEWFGRTLSLGDEGKDVLALRERLSPDMSDCVLFDDELHRAVLRFQSSRGLPLTGKVTEEMALLLP